MLQMVLDLRIKELPNLLLVTKDGMRKVWKYQEFKEAQEKLDKKLNE